MACKDEGGNWYLAGVVSWGDGCGVRDRPGVYSSVGYLNDWIKGIIPQWNEGTYTDTCIMYAQRPFQ